jgi:hypothetical protein
MKLQKEMTKEELIHFFSQTTEFTVGPTSSKKDEDNNEIIPDTYELHCEGQSLLIYKPTIQTLIRAIWQLSGLVTKKG